MDIKIDEAQEAERTEVLALTLDAYGEYEKHSNPGFWEKYCENISQAILHGPAKILIARCDEKILGSVLYCQPNSGTMKNDYPEMRLLAVSPEARQLGIAQLLINECEQLARISGTLTLHTTDLMQTAKAMYQRRAYV